MTQKTALKISFEYQMILRFFVIVSISLAACTQEKPAEPSISEIWEKAEKAAAASPWVLAAGHLYKNVVLYYGPDESKRWEVGQVIALDYDNKLVMVRMKGGSVEPKSRDAIAGGPWYIKKSDPALQAREF